jgi:hypothetical protein
MRRVLIMLIGLALLAAGLVLLWMSYGPQPKEERVTGGVLTTQEEIAAQGVQGGAPDLGVVTDQGPSSTNIVGGAEFSGEALSDVAAFEQGSEAAPETTAIKPGLTTDVVLDDNIEVAVAPLNTTAEAAPAGDGQGGPVSTENFQQRVVELEWPAEFRVGRSGLVRIKLKVLEGGLIQPVAEVADNEVVATPILITDRFDTYDGTVTATLSAPDFDVESTSAATQVLTRTGEPEWRWTLESDETGGNIITLSLSITWQPKPGTTGTVISNTIWGQTLNVDVNYVFGILTVPQSSIAGIALAALGAIGQVPLLEKILEIFLDILFGGNRRRDDRRRNDRRRRRR